jgi:hypothetical protein
VSVYRDSRELAGVTVWTKSKVIDWSGWPADVEPTLRHWNRKGRLSFRQETIGFWGPPATGLPCLTAKCVDCGRFFNQRWACLLDNCWVCDDCVITRARQSPVGAP